MRFLLGAVVGALAGAGFTYFWACKKTVTVQVSAKLPGPVDNLPPLTLPQSLPFA